MAHGTDWQKATDEAAARIRENLGAEGIDYALRNAVPTEFISFEVLSHGSPFGALEELERGTKITKTYDFYSKSLNNISIDFEKLVKDGYLPQKDPKSFPTSYVSGKEWYQRLLESAKTPNGNHWYTYYHLGVVAYQLKNLDDAIAHFQHSNTLLENAWSTRNLALIALHSKNSEYAARLMTRAVQLCPKCVNLYPDAMKCYLADKQYERAVDCFESAPFNVRSRGRMQLLLSVAYMKLGRYTDAAKYINRDFKMDDMREGEISLSHVWSELYTAILQKNSPDMNIDELISLQKEKYPLPPHLDFRMHDEDEEGL